MGDIGAGTLSSNIGNSATENYDNSSNAMYATVQTAYAPIISIGKEGSLTYSGSDYGAIAAATGISEKALNLVQASAYDSQVTARMALERGADLTAAQGPGLLTMLSKPFAWVVGLAIVVVGFVIYKWRSRT